MYTHRNKCPHQQGLKPTTSTRNPGHAPASIIYNVSHHMYMRINGSNSTACCICTCIPTCMPLNFHRNTAHNMSEDTYIDIHVVRSAVLDDCCPHCAGLWTNNKNFKGRMDMQIHPCMH